MARSNLYSSIVWAVFMTGAAHLGLVLAGQWAYLLALLSVAGLFALLLYKTNIVATSLKQIALPYALAAALFLLFNTCYIFLVFVEASTLLLIFLNAPVLLLIVPLLILFPFLRRRSYVTQ